MSIVPDRWPPAMPNSVELKVAKKTLITRMRDNLLSEFTDDRSVEHINEMKMKNTKIAIDICHKTAMLEILAKWRVGFGIQLNQQIRGSGRAAWSVPKHIVAGSINQMNESMEQLDRIVLANKLVNDFMEEQNSANGAAIDYDAMEEDDSDVENYLDYHMDELRTLYEQICTGTLPEQ